MKSLAYLTLFLLLLAMPLLSEFGSTAVTYSTLSPWAEVDSPPLKQIQPRLTNLDSQTIGLFANMKRSSTPMQAAVEDQLKTKFPKLKFTTFRHRENADVFGSAQESAYKDWLKGVDAVIAAAGD